jgi:hypothetical protein
VMKILIVSGHMKLIKEILTIVKNRFVKLLKKNLYFLTKTNLMRSSISIKNTKDTTDSHFWKKSEAKKYHLNFNFLSKKIQDGHIKFKIMIPKQTMLQHKIQVILKSILKQVNAELFSDSKFKSQI